jgi:hypothetical protein
MRQPIITTTPADADAGLSSRDYCFMIMSYRQQQERVFDDIMQRIAGDLHLRCERADRVLLSGADLLAKVHALILGSSIVIADLTDNRPNVYYEYGYAAAHDRLPILIAQAETELETDLHGKEVLRYSGAPGNDHEFIGKLLRSVKERLRSPIPEQRRMLGSPQPFPAYVLVAPRAPGLGSRHPWHPDERTTFGDMLGIAGILTAYGNLWGVHERPQLLHAASMAKDVLFSAANVFCIGSPKVNPATAYFLELTQAGLEPHWKMPEVPPDDDPRIVIQGDASLDETLRNPIDDPQADRITDYGLVIRAPHPSTAHHLVWVLAGRHSIGTHAACAVATDPKLIRDLEDMLPGGKVAMANSGQPFWAVVKGALNRFDMSIEVVIVKAGGYAGMRT